MNYITWISKGISLNKSEETILYQGLFTIPKNEQNKFESSITELFKSKDEEQNIHLRYSSNTVEDFKKKTLDLFKKIVDLEVSLLKPTESRIIKMKVNK